MKHAAEIASFDMIYLLSFMKIGSDILVIFTVIPVASGTRFVNRSRQ
jgi:hypothetical protein